MYYLWKSRNRYKMKLLRYISVLSAVLMSVSVHAQTKDDAKVSFAYDVDFQMQFDNREFYRSGFTPSMTIFGARLTPSVGLAVQQSNGTLHKLMAGIDVMKDFGNSPVSSDRAAADSPETDNKLSNLKLFREITLYYSVEKQMGKTGLSLHAGVFPRRFSEGNYSRAFFSDSLRFYDNNLEGLLIKVHKPKAYYEVGCDWMGMYDTFRRERFMIFSSGEAQVAPVLSLGYSAYLYHYSCSRIADGVVDNVLLNPYLKLGFEHLVDIQKLSLRVGWLQAMQNDRAMVGKYVFPGGAELDFEVQKWNVGIRNELFFGKDMMPYYSSVDPAGYTYSNLLYMGSPFYRVHDDGKSGPGIADRLEVYYSPKIGNPYLDLKVSAIFHFNGNKYSGCRQMVSLNFNLQELLSSRRK